MFGSRRYARLAGLILLTALLAFSLTGCRGLAARRAGPIDAFAFLPSGNPGLSQPVQGAINNRPSPKEIALVVPPGTDMSRLVASITLRQEATITVISTGQRVVQQNGVTPNNFNSPVTYAIEVPDEEEPVLYTVRVREASTNARLIDLTVADSVFMTPTFGPNVSAYEAEVPFATRTVQVSARAEDPKASAVSIAGRKAGAGAGSGSIDFSTGDSVEVVVEVVAEDQSTRQEYRITIVRGDPDRNSNLGSLMVNGETLLMSSAGPDGSFQIGVPFSASEIAVNATPESPLASIAVNGMEGASVSVPLEPATNQTVELVVTAEDGSTSSYGIRVVRAAADDNAVLAKLSTSVGKLTPDFSPKVLEYSLVLPVDQASVVIGAAAESALTSVVASTEDGGLRQEDGSNRAEIGINLEEGEQAVVVITSVAESGTTREYRVALRRDIGLASLFFTELEMVGADFTPAFDPNVTEYKASVPADVEFVTVYPTPLDESAVLFVNGNESATWPAVVDVLLYEGMTVTTPLALRAPNGLERVYTITVDRGTTPSRIGRRILEVTLDGLRLSRMVASSLNSSGAAMSSRARITVRYQDTGEVIYEDNAPITMEQARQDIMVSMAYRSQFIDMDLGKYLDIEVAIPTSNGRFLHFNTAAYADGSLDIRPGFLVLSDTSVMEWPAPGTPRPVSPRVRYEVSDAAMRRLAELGDAFVLNDAGEFDITLVLFNLSEGVQLGSEVLGAKPGSVHGKGIRFAEGIELPEGATIGYLLYAMTRDGRTLRDHGSLAVRTTRTFENGDWEYADLYVESVLELIERPGM